MKEAARAEGVSDFGELVEILRRDPEVQNRYRSRFDSVGRVFHVLNDLSHVKNHGLEVKEVEEGDRPRYEFTVNGHAPSVVLATPTSERGRSVLLAVSDYLVGTHEPGVGCVDCVTSDSELLFYLLHSYRCFFYNFFLLVFFYCILIHTDGGIDDFFRLFICL